MTVNRSPNSLAATSQPSSEFFRQDRKSTRLNSSHSQISYAVFCLKKKKLFPHILYIPMPSTISQYQDCRRKFDLLPTVIPFEFIYMQLAVHAPQLPVTSVHRRSLP